VNNVSYSKNCITHFVAYLLTLHNQHHLRFTLMLRSILLFVGILSSVTSWSQIARTSATHNIRPEQREKIYKTNPKWEIPASLALIGAASLGYKWMDQRASLTAEQAALLNPLNINSFDRPAAYYDPAGFVSANNKSDVLMTVFVASPLLLVFDKKIRRDWVDMLTMLGAAHGVDNTIFFSSILLVRRPRPLTYNPGLPIEVTALTPGVDPPITVWVSRKWNLSAYSNGEIKDTFYLDTSALNIEVRASGYDPFSLPIDISKGRKVSLGPLRLVKKIETPIRPNPDQIVAANFPTPPITEAGNYGGAQ